MIRVETENQNGCEYMKRLEFKVMENEKCIKLQEVQSYGIRESGVHSISEGFLFLLTKDKTKG